jgi:hypothetical protein
MGERTEAVLGVRDRPGEGSPVRVRGVLREDMESNEAEEGARWFEDDEGKMNDRGVAGWELPSSRWVFNDGSDGRDDWVYCLDDASERSSLALFAAGRPSTAKSESA